MRLDLRALRRDDLPRVAELARELFSPLRVDARALERNLFDDEGADDELRLVAEEQGHAIAYAAGVLRRDAAAEDGPPEDERVDDRVRGHLKLLLVEPARRRGGVGSRLLDIFEQVAHSRGARSLEIDGAAPRYLLPGLPSSAEPARRLLERAGYELLETRRSMTAPLTGIASPPERQRIGDALLRRARPEDMAWVVPEIAEGFSENWAKEVAVSILDLPPGTHLALEEHTAARSREPRVLGFACAALWAPNAFGPIGTRPEARGRGLGAALLKRCLGDLASRGEPSAVISWVGPEVFYRRFAAAEFGASYLALRKRLR